MNTNEFDPIGPHEPGETLKPEELKVFLRKTREAIEALERAVSDDRLEHSDLRVLVYLTTRRALTPVWDSQEGAVVPAIRVHEYETAADIARKTNMGRTSVTRSIARLEETGHISVEMRSRRSWIAVLAPEIPAAADTANTDETEA